MAAAQSVGHPGIVHQPALEQPKAVDVKGIQRDVKVYRGLANPYLTVTLFVVAILTAVAVAFYASGQFQKWMSPERFAQFKKLEALFLGGTIAAGVFCLALGGLSLAQAIDVYHSKRFPRLPEPEINPNEPETRPVAELRDQAIKPKEPRLDAETVWEHYLNPPKVEEDGVTAFNHPTEEEMAKIGLPHEKVKELKESFRWDFDATKPYPVCLEDIKNWKGEPDRLIFCGTLMQISTGLEINVVGLTVSEDKVYIELQSRFDSSVLMAHLRQPNPDHFVFFGPKHAAWMRAFAAIDEMDEGLTQTHFGEANPVAKAFDLKKECDSARVTLFLPINDREKTEPLILSTTLQLFNFRNPDDFDFLFNPGLAEEGRGGKRIDLQHILKERAEEIEGLEEVAEPVQEQPAAAPRVEAVTDDDDVPF
jgi:5-methylcytosine-specific restriction endonuclease McrA